MANIKSAKKRILVTAKKTLRNKMVKSRVKTEVRKLNDSIKSNLGTEATVKAFRQAISTIDKAKSKGVIHKKTAARRQSRLAKMMNKLAQ